MNTCNGIIPFVSYLQKKIRTQNYHMEYALWKKTVLSPDFYDIPNDNKKRFRQEANSRMTRCLLLLKQEFKQAGLLYLSTPETQFREKMLFTCDKEYTPSNWGIRTLMKIDGYTGMFD